MAEYKKDKDIAAAGDNAEDVQVIKFNVNDLSLGDLADLEDATGVSFMSVNMNNLPLKAAIGLYWIIRRKVEPKFTYAQARSLKMGEIEAFKDFLSQVKGKA